MMIDDPRPRTTDTGTVDVDNPWPGLAAFREADQLFFQGRETVVDELTRMVLRARLTVLHGVSGLGKTSVLRAGLFPRVRREHVLPIYVRLGHSEDSPEPVIQVRDAIQRAAQASGVEAPVWSDGLTLWEYFHRRDAQFWDARNRILTPLLVFDQFEELFTLGRSTAERRTRTDAFTGELSDLVEGRPAADVRARLEQDPEAALRFSMSDQPCKVLLSLREDFLPDLAELRSRMPAITEAMYRLQPMTTAEAMRVVEIGGGHLVDHDVAEQIVRFVASARSEAGGDGDTGIVEPALLSVFCRELNNKRRAQGGEKITANLLEGSRTAIISDFYERTISEGGLSGAIRVFVEERLLTESGFRDSVAEEQALRTPGISPADVETLIARRLLRREDAGTKGRSRLELTHDVLAQAVRASRDRRRLREQQARAIAEQRAVEARLRQDAEEAAAREQQRREFEAAQALAATQQEAAALAQALAREEQKARAAAERLAETERRTRRRQMVSLSVVLIAIAALAVVALLMAKRSRDEATRANVAEARATRALSAAYVDRVRPDERWKLPLLARAVKMNPGDTMARALLMGLLVEQVMPLSQMDHIAPVERAVLNAAGDRALTQAADGTARLWNARSGVELARAERNRFISFSPDGRRALTVSADGVARVWNAESGTQLGPELAHGGRVYSAAFDGQGNRVVTASADGRLRVWQPQTGERTEIHAAGEPVVQTAFDPSDTLVLAVSATGEAGLWDARSGSLVARLTSGSDEGGLITHIEFSPDGASVLATLMDGRARLIASRSGRPIGQPLEQAGPIMAAQFDPAGERIVTTSVVTNEAGEASGVASVWDSRTGRILTEMRHGSSITMVAFSSDGARIVTTSSGGTARVWDVANGRQVEARRDYGRWVAWAGFSPDGTRVLTASADGTAQLWDARTGSATGSPLRHEGPVVAAAFSADGAMVLTASTDQTARLWDARTGLAIETRLRHADGLRITLAAISPDGAFVATAGSLDPDLPESIKLARAREETAVRIWDAATGKPVGDVRHGGAIKSLRFSPDGMPRLVTASADGTAQVWDARTAAPVASALRHDGPVFSAAFSSDGTRIVTASADRTARVWDAATAREIVRPLEHPAEVRSAAFSSGDVELLVTGSIDGNARLWNTGTGESTELPLTCVANDDAPSDYGAPPVTAVAFSPDGTRLLTSSDAETLLWNVETREKILPCLRHQGARNLPVVSPGESLVVTTSTTDLARVWDIREEPVVRWELPRAEAVLSAAFTGDGRLITAAADGFARIWNLRTGAEVGLRLQHDTELLWVAFSNRGSRVLTLAADGIARTWDAPSGASGEAAALADLAEAIAGQALDDEGVTHGVEPKALAGFRERSTRVPARTTAESFVQWLFEDPTSRTISPLSRMTVPEYIAQLLQEGEAGTREAMRLFPGHPALPTRTTAEAMGPHASQATAAR